MSVYTAIHDTLLKNKGDGSQSGEISVIKSMLTSDSPKFIVDVGAYDGSTISNSAHFIKKGWHGLLVEPAPIAFEKLDKKYRSNRRVTCFNLACSDENGVSDFYFGPDGEDSMFNTLYRDENEWFDSNRGDNHITVKVQKLNEILNQEEFPKDFSILLVDTEGMDYEVLRGLDFNIYRPRIIVTEEYKWNLEKHESKYKLLKNNGYEMNKIIGCNSIWINTAI